MRRLLALTAVACCMPIAAAAAQHQIIQKGNIRVSFGGELLPVDLPRERLAPVTVHLDGSVASVDDNPPPPVRKISIAFTRAGHLSAAGLPTCPAAALQQTSTETALRACRGALVGHGRFAAGVDFPGAPVIPANGKVLVFNSRRGGEPAMLLHLYGSTPVPAAFVLPMDIS